MDRCVASYALWRERCEDVATAYERWARAAHADRELAFAGYVAALDREDHAARVHRDYATRVRAAARGSRRR